MAKVVVVQSAEGMGSGSRLDYGEMGAVEVELELHGHFFSVGLQYSEMDMQPLELTVHDLGYEDEKKSDLLYNKVFSNAEVYQDE